MDLIETLRRARIPQFTLPRLVGAVHARLPQLPPTLGLTTALNLALDRILPRISIEGSDAEAEPGGTAPAAPPVHAGS